jgi:hypothetical protein
LPWLEGTVQPYARALRGWRDVTKDVSYEPGPTQFRIDLRLLARAIEIRWPARIATVPGSSLVGGIAFSFRVWELFVLTLVLQIGMLPSLASEFHRVTFAGIFVNFAVVPLTTIIVPLGFCALMGGFLWPALGKILAGVLSWITAASPGSAAVRASTATELSHTGSAALDDDYFPIDAGGYYGVFATAIHGAQGDDVGFVGGIDCGCSDHC